MAELLAELYITTYFFEQTINGKIYLDFLRNHLPDYLEKIPLDVRQLDGCDSSMMARLHIIIVFEDSSFGESKSSNHP